MEAPTSCSTSRMEAFPAGLRVLVVDDDPTWLKILEKMLRKCSYEVTTCGLARAALDMLRERRDRFDIVISDVNMPDMDGFKLLEHVGLEMDLPVIMMSVDGETSRVMKGVQHGACDYLLKPVRMKELRNIWQHVFRKKIHEIKEVESHDSSEEFQFLKCRFDEFEERQMLYGGDMNSTKKRKDMENREHFEPDFVDPASVKKARVVWTVDLHQKFVNAVNHIGFDKVGPKKILDLMRVPGLTRENVASHLQKYRLYLSRLQKQNEGITFGGPFPSNRGSDDATGNFSLQSPVAVSQNGPPTDGSGFSPKGNHAASVKAEVIGDDQGIAMLRKGSPRSPTTSQKAKSATQSGGMILQKDVTAGAGYRAHSASFPSQHSWNGGIAAIPFTEYRRHDHVSSKLLKDYQQLQHTGKKSNGGEDYLFSTSANPVASSRRQDESGTFHIRRAYVDIRSNMQACSAPLQVHQGALDCKILGVIPEDDRSSDVEGQQHVDQDLFDRLDSPHQKNNLKDGSVLSSSPEDLLCSLEEYGCFDSIDVNNNTMEILNCSNSDQITEIQGDLYDDLQLDCEYIFELMKYPTTSGGDLFT